jgi:hypothetical protein
MNMKKSLLFCVMLLMAIVMKAQLTVDNFEQRINDQSGMATNITVRDPNGDRCALIKVFAPQVDGFSFYGGVTSGFLTTETHGNEIWVFAPASAQSITISHALFGRVEYEYPVALGKGSTYELLLNVGSGRFVNINSTGTTEARVTIDGKYVGVTPIYNHFMPFGKYQVVAEKDRFEGKTEIEVEPKKKKGDAHQQSFNIQMIDQTPHYGDVTVTVNEDPNAEIFYQGERVGAGTWKSMLKEGTHEIIARKADCNDAVTIFTVKPQVQNDITADAPTPHTGNVQIYTRPRNVVATYDGEKSIDLTDINVMTVGTHQFAISRKGYVTSYPNILVRHNETTVDTIALEPINYIKEKWAFYFGVGYTLSSLSGLTTYAGAVWNHIDAQLSYTLGLSKSDKVHMYSNVFGEGHNLNSINDYKMNSFALRVGYQIRLVPLLGITPQVGVMTQTLTSNLIEGTTKYADGAKATSLTFGAKILGVPAHRVYVFLTPELALPISKDDTFNKAAKAGDFSAGGFSVSLGVLLNFGK